MFAALSSLPGLALTYFASSFCLFSLLSRLFKDEGSCSPRLFLMSLGLGPMAVSWTLSTLLRLFPGHADAFYISAVCLCLLAMLALSGGASARSFNESLAAAGSLLKSLRGSMGRNWFEFAVLGLVGALLATIFILSAILPISENDALMYASYARHIYNHKDLACYPFTTPDPESGLYSVGAHPVGYHSLMVWSHMLQGSAAEAGAAKLICPFFALYTVLMLACAPWPEGRLRRSAFAVFALLSTPIYFIQASDQSIDPLRMYTFSLSFFALWEFLRTKSKFNLALLSTSVGFSLYSHQLGLFALPFIAAALLFFTETPWAERLKAVSTLTVVATLLGSFQYVANFLKFGSPFTPYEPVFAIKELGFGKYFSETRGMHNFADRLLFGWLQGFSKPVSFGLSFWLAAWAGVRVLREWVSRRSLALFSFESAALLGALMFQALLLVPLIAKDDLNLAHSRYFMTALPLVACLAASSLTRIYEKWFER